MSDQQAVLEIGEEAELALLNNGGDDSQVRGQVRQNTTKNGQHSPTTKDQTAEASAITKDTRKKQRTQQINLQKVIIHDLTTILNETVTEDGVRKLQAWLEDPRIQTLQDLTKDVKSWEEPKTINKPKSFLFSTKIQPHLGRMLKNNILYQPYLECFIARFAAVNEKIMPERNAPIHYAVESLNISFLEWLLNHKENKCEINSRNKWAKTALFLLCEQYKRSQQLSPDKVDDIRRCILLLLDHGADFNICSDRLELPFELLMRNQSDENKQFLQKCVQKFGNAIAIGKKNEMNQRTIELYQYPVKPVSITVELLEIYLRFKEEDKFTKEFEKFADAEDNVKAVIKLLLHTAVELDMDKSVRKIVECAGPKIFEKVDQDNKLSLVYRVQLKGLLKKACDSGSVATLNLLLTNISDRILINDDPILVLILNRAQELRKRPDERARVLQFAEMLAKNPKIYLSKTDNNGNTALHVALKFGFTDIALVLLQQKYAFLGARNKDNMTPLDYARYDFWKQYFDQCVSIEAKKSNHRSRVQINLSGLDPYVFKKRQAKKAAQKNRAKQNPWRIIESATEENVTNRRHQSVVTEMDPIYQMAQSKELKPLLLHPVVYTFIQVKWLRLVKWKYLNFIAILATVVCFCLQRLESCIERYNSLTLDVLTWIGVAYIIIREIVQVLFLRWMYFASFENFLDVATVVSMIIVLQNGCSSILSSLTVIAFALQFTVLAGSLPFNALSTYMYMFKKVSLNFMKSFLLFIPLLLAFIYGFFLSYNDKTTKHNYAEDEIPFNRFATFNDAALKTLIMTTGEYEGAGLDFSGGKIIIFVLFIFFAPIVILNLINGLAVSDITAIKQQSKLISIRKKVLLLQRYERGINNMPVEIIRRLFPTSFFDTHSYKIMVKPKEFRKILVHRPGGGWQTVPIIPVSQGAEGSYIKPLKFPLFLTLDKHIMDETLRIVDESIIQKKTFDNRRLEIGSVSSGTINGDIQQEEMPEELSSIQFVDDWNVVADASMNGQQQVAQSGSGTIAAEATCLILENNRQEKRLLRKNLQIALNDELETILDETSIEDGLPKLQAWLEDPRIQTLDNLIEDMKNWDTLTTIPEPKTFLFNSKLQPLLDRMLDNNVRYQTYLEPFISRFEAVNEKILPELNAPIHYAVESLNISFLEWLLAQPHIKVNSRNKQAKTALFLLCEQYEAVMNSPKFKKRVQQLAQNPVKVEDIRQCILLLLDHGADFNICSDRLKLPFELLMRNHSEENRHFLKECAQRFGDGIAIGKRNDRKHRTVGFYQDWLPMNVTVELLEIYLRFKEEEKFARELEKFEVDEENLGHVIKLLLHIAVELDMERSVKKIVECAGRKIFQVVKVQKGRAAAKAARNQIMVRVSDPEPDIKSSELIHRVHLKGLLKKACECGNVTTLNLLLSNITDRVLVNDDPILVLTLNRAQELWKREEERAKVLQCAELLAKDQKIFLSRTDNNGNTALHAALKYGFTDIALDLLQQKYAFLGVRNKDNLTPLDYARYDFWKLYFDQCVSIDVRRAYCDRTEVQINLNGFDPYIFKKRQAKKAAQKDRSEQNLWRIVEKASPTNVVNREQRTEVTEMDPIYQIAKSKELKRLLLHPVIYTFILVKWLRLTKWSYLNFICTLATVICFGLQSLETCVDGNHSITLHVLSWIGAVYMIVRESVQILFLRWMYFSSFENFLDIATVISMIIVLQNGCRSVLSSLIVISFALELTVLVGSLPFNTLSTYMYMFKKVSANFMKSFLLFIPLLLAFTYGFFLSYNDKTTEHNYPEDDVPFNRFGDVIDAALKTLVMTTGEYEGAGMDFSGGKIIIFVLFVFFAPIVILNLINGLAVSDITAIKQESELISIRRKVLLLERYERGLRNMPIELIRRLFPTSFFENHSYMIVVKPKEFRKILVQVVQSPDNQRNQQKPLKGEWEVVPNLPIGWLARGAEGFYIKLLKFPLFLTLDKHIMDEALRIADESIILREMLDNKRLEIASAASGTIELDIKMEELREEMLKMGRIMSRMMLQRSITDKKVPKVKKQMLRKVKESEDKEVFKRVANVARTVQKFKKNRRKKSEKKN